MTSPRRTPFALALLLALLPLPSPLTGIGGAGAATPSFDCAAAKLPVERAICGSATLAAMDVEIAQAYGHAVQALPGGLRDILRRAQRIFLTARDEAFGLPDEDLEARLSEQITFLKAIELDGRTAIEGSWRNGLGAVEITARPDGDVDVLIGTAEPVRARWLCDFEGVARKVAAHWEIAADPASTDDWGVTLTPRGGALTVTVTPPAGGGAGGLPQPPFCGHGGTIEGDYLAVKPVPDWVQ